MDAVIVWSDTVKKEYRSRKINYIKEARIPQMLGERTLGELLIMITAISINCRDFIDSIVVVCEEAECRIDDFISVNRIHNYLPIRYIHHTELFKGFEGYLPCYSPISIRSLLYRCREIDEEFTVFDFSCIPMTTMNLSELALNAKSRNKVSSLWKRKNAARLYPPSLVRKREIEEKIRNSPGLLSSNLKCRFDSECQREILLHPIGYADIDGQICVITPSEDEDEFVSALDRAKNCHLLAIPAFSQFSKEQARSLSDWLCAKFRIRLLT